MLFTALGSLGDIKPLAAIAQVARDAGHAVRFATSQSYQQVVESAGLAFDLFGDDDYFNRSDVRDAMVDPREGFGVFMWHSNLADLEALYSRLDGLAAGVDLIVATPMVMAAHLVAQRRGVPLVSCSLSPATLLLDPSSGTVDPHAREWRSRLNALRGAIGLASRGFPQMERFNVDLTLGVYPECLAGAQGRYVRVPVEVGYPPLRQETQLDRDLAAWLDGRPYALFSFGSFIDRGAARHLQAASAACRELGLRCLFLSRHSAQALEPGAAADVRVVSSVAHECVMPRAEVIVHHGGTGTLAASIEARRPVVVTPFGLDQTFNARCLEERDLAELLDAGSVTPEALTGALSRALAAWPRREPRWGAARRSVGPQAAQSAVDEIERLLARGAAGRLGQPQLSGA